MAAGSARSLAASPTLELSPFRLRSRDAPGPRRAGERRQLKARSTNEDADYLELLRLNGAFNEESKHGGSLIAGAAVFGEKAVDFIKAQDGNRCSRAGYVCHMKFTDSPLLQKVFKDFSHDEESRHLRVVQQLFVKPGFRQRSLATRALQQLTQQMNKVIVEAPVDRTHKAMIRNGFHQGVVGSSCGSSWILYLRPPYPSCLARYDKQCGDSFTCFIRPENVTVDLEGKQDAGGMSPKKFTTSGQPSSPKRCPKRAATDTNFSTPRKKRRNVENQPMDDHNNSQSPLSVRELFRSRCAAA